MRFVSILAVVCAVFKTAGAVNPGNNALGMGVSDNFEAAIQKEYGPIVFDSLADSKCNGWDCLKTVVGTTTCILKCVEKNNPACVFLCAPPSEICPCIDCYPKIIVDFLNKWHVCDEELNARLFSKVYLGLASDDEQKTAQGLGYAASVFGV